jgi:hypothetical protein
MPKFRPQLRTLRESNQVKKQKAVKPNKLFNLQRRYSIEKGRNSNTVYQPRPIVKKSRKKPIKPSGRSWNLMLQELNKPVPQKKSLRKYTETFGPIRPLSKLVKPYTKKLYKGKSSRNLFQEELNRIDTNNTLYKPSPRGTRI